MLVDNLESIRAVGLWSALNLGLMLALALNAFRWRFKEMVPVGVADGSPGLERAIRAHGNNIEYVPGILFGLLMLAILGESVDVLHIAGAVLLAARLLHAVGIQQLEKVAPPARVVGNIICWVLFLAMVVRLFMLAL